LPRQRCQRILALPLEGDNTRARFSPLTSRLRNALAQVLDPMFYVAEPLLLRADLPLDA
jgi:hypothetical protein